MGSVEKRECRRYCVDGESTEKMEHLMDVSPGRLQTTRLRPFFRQMLLNGVKCSRILFCASHLVVWIKWLIDTSGVHWFSSCVAGCSIVQWNPYFEAAADGWVNLKGALPFSSHFQWHRRFIGDVSAVAVKSEQSEPQRQVCSVAAPVEEIVGKLKYCDVQSLRRTFPEEPFMNIYALQIGLCNSVPACLPARFHNE